MMRLKQILITFLITVIFLILPMQITLAAANNQDLNQSAILISPEPSYKIDIYPKPSKDSGKIGYGLGGDEVKVIEKVGSNESDAWYFVKFSQSPYTEGWIEKNYISLQEQDYLGGSKKQQDNSSRYRGDYVGQQQDNSSRYRGDYVGQQQDNSSRYRGDYQGNR